MATARGRCVAHRTSRRCVRSRGASIPRRSSAAKCMGTQSVQSPTFAAPLASALPARRVAGTRRTRCAAARISTAMIAQTNRRDVAAAAVAGGARRVARWAAAARVCARHRVAGGVAALFRGRVVANRRAACGVVVANRGLPRRAERSNTCQTTRGRSCARQRSGNTSNSQRSQQGTWTWFGQNRSNRERQRRLSKSR